MAKKFYGNSNFSNMSVVLNNVFLLYFILILALSNLFYLVSSSNYMFASIFIITGFLTSFFSKNMIVILCIALTITNVLQFGKNASAGSSEFASSEFASSEGFAGDEKDDDDTPKKKNKKYETVDTKDNNPNLDNITSDYKELLGLQDKITDNMSNLNNSLTKSENILKNLAKTINVDIDM